MLKKNLIKDYAKYFFIPLGIIVGVILVAYFVLNIHTLWKKADYFYTTKIKDENYAENSIFLPEINPNQLKVAKTPTNNQNNINLQNNHLYIPKLNINAPIMWNVPEEKMIDELSNGVVHFAGSQVPGEDGNVFLTGHSSYYWWSKSKYKTVFALLPQMKSGDTIILTHNNEVYIYQVTKTMTVDPLNIAIIAPSDKEEVTLMTCVPVGTAISRFVVKAELIYPLNEGDRTAPTAEKIKLLTSHF